MAGAPAGIGRAGVRGEPSFSTLCWRRGNGSCESAAVLDSHVCVCARGVFAVMSSRVPQRPRRTLPTEVVVNA